MLVITHAAKGGTGRTVAAANIGHRLALRGADVCHLDLDTGAATAASVLGLPAPDPGGTHSLLLGRAGTPARLDVWERSRWFDPQGRPPGAGRHELLPGDPAGGDFPADRDVVARLVELLLRLDEEFDMCLLDLRSGRSFMVDAVLAATADPRIGPIERRWLIFHRWTEQHLLATHALMHDERGLLACAGARGHDETQLLARTWYVRAAGDGEPDPATGRRLARLAGRLRLAERVAATVAYDRDLAWREHLVTGGPATAAYEAVADLVDTARRVPAGTGAA
ncbi:SCO2523 family variant P-loop protein [Micromonospora tulbaghiae]|uniref:SCO2523 family variant P-loop protein n=1 Tax=Micromonospora tulbaghiae TaxID=479978 RepID=UPI003674D273